MALRVFFFDAGAIVKLVVDEKGSKEVCTVARNAHVIRCTTWLSLAEAYGVLKRLWLNEEMEEKVYHRKLYDLQYNVQECIEIDVQEKLPHPTFQKVIEIQKKYNLDFSDALHIAILQSEPYKAFVGDSKPVLVASDKDLLQAAKDEGIDTWNPEKDEPPWEAKLEG